MAIDEINDELDTLPIKELQPVCSPEELEQNEVAKKIHRTAKDVFKELDSKQKTGSKTIFEEMAAPSSSSLKGRTENNTGPYPAREILDLGIRYEKKMQEEVKEKERKVDEHLRKIQEEFTVIKKEITKMTSKMTDEDRIELPEDFRQKLEALFPGIEFKDNKADRQQLSHISTEVQGMIDAAQSESQKSVTEIQTVIQNLQTIMDVLKKIIQENSTGIRRAIDGQKSH